MYLYVFSAYALAGDGPVSMWSKRIEHPAPLSAISSVPGP